MIIDEAGIFNCTSLGFIYVWLYNPQASIINPRLGKDNDPHHVNSRTSKLSGNVIAKFVFRKLPIYVFYSFSRT